MGTVSAPQIPREALSVGATVLWRREPWPGVGRRASVLTLANSCVPGWMYCHPDPQPLHLESEQNIVPASWVVVRSR